MSVGLTISGGCLVIDGGCLATGPCGETFTCDDVPFPLTITFPDTSVWGWDPAIFDHHLPGGECASPVRSTATVSAFNHCQQETDSNVCFGGAKGADFVIDVLYVEDLSILTDLDGTPLGLSGTGWTATLADGSESPSEVELLWLRYGGIGDYAGTYNLVYNGVRSGAGIVPPTSPPATIVVSP